MSVVQVEGRRRGRDARVAARGRPLEDAARPVWPGLKGGALQAARRRRHPEDPPRRRSTCWSRSASPTPSRAASRRSPPVGGIHGDDGRLRFPRALVEDTIARATRRFALHGQDPRHDMEPWGKNVYFGTAGAAVHIVDPDHRRVPRDSTVEDLYDFARIVDELRQHPFLPAHQRVPRDHRPLRDGLQHLLRQRRGHDEACRHELRAARARQACLEMLHMVAGGEDKWRARPFVSQSNCFVVPPLKFAEDACRCLEVAVRGGMPVLLLVGGAGGRDRARGAGGHRGAGGRRVPGRPHLRQRDQARRAGDLRHLAVRLRPAHRRDVGRQRRSRRCSRPACAQMAQFYDLMRRHRRRHDRLQAARRPGRLREGPTNLALVGNAGTNLIYESAGMHAEPARRLPGDARHRQRHPRRDAAHHARHRGERRERCRSRPSATVCLDGPGHYLGSPQTLELMQRDYVYPTVGDRSSPKEWNERGRPKARAVTRMRDRAIRPAPQRRADADPHVPRLPGATSPATRRMRALGDERVRRALLDPLPVRGCAASAAMTEAASGSSPAVAQRREGDPGPRALPRRQHARERRGSSS